MLFSTARHANVIKITTIQGGYNAGRSYSLQAPSSDTCTMVSRPQPLTSVRTPPPRSPLTPAPATVTHHQPTWAQVMSLLGRYVEQARKKAVVRSSPYALV